MKEVCTQQSAIPALEAACQQFDKLYRGFVPENQDDLDTLEKISKEITKILAAHYDGKIEIPEKLLAQAERKLGKSAVLKQGTNLTLPQSNPQQLLQTFFANIPEAIYWIDKDSRIIACNEAEARIFGLTAEEAIGKNVQDLGRILNWEPGIAEKLIENNQDVIRTGKSVAMEEEIVGPNGELKTFITHKMPFRDENNEIAGIIGLSINTTSLKERERSLQDAISEAIKEQNEANRRLNAIISNLPEAIYLIDEEGRGVICNEAESRLFGFGSPDDMIGRNVFDFAEMLDWEPGIAEQLRENDRHIMESGQGQIIEEGITTSDGESKQVLTHKIPYRDENGKIAGIIGISFDITERKRMEEDLKKAKEQAEAANKAKTEFLNNIRHDTRTPMYGITGSANLLLHQIDELQHNKPVNFEEMNQYAANILHAGNALSEMFDELIETVRVYDGKLRVLQRRFSLSEQLQQIVKFNSPTAQQKRLDFSFNYDESIPHHFIGDDTIVRRIIQELVVNAIKFTEKGSVRINAQLLRADDKTATVHITVSDTGSGIPKEQQEKIFNYFQRLTPSHEGRYSGLGAGLFRVKGYLDKLGGDIAVASRLGQGTDMTCIIPFKIADKQFGIAYANPAIEHEETPLLQAQPEVNLNTIAAIDEDHALTHILLVEDSQSAALVTKGILKNLDCAVDVAETGEKAIEMFQAKKYEFVFMDVGLPGISGIETTKAIRETSEGKSIPIVALTAHVEGEAKQACRDAGMDATVSKPLTPNKAENILNAFLPSRLPSDNVFTEEKPGAHLHKDLPTNKEELFDLNIYPVFDQDAALRTIENNIDLLSDVIRLFLSEGLIEDKNRMAEAYAQADWKTVQDVAHKLKSSALYCGAIRMKMACQYMERYTRAGLTEHSENLYQQLLLVIGETETELASWLENHEANRE